MTKSQELRQKYIDSRKKVEDKLLSLRDEVVKVYLTNEGRQEGDECYGIIDLPTSYIHQYIDDQINEVIYGVHTTEDCVMLDYGTGITRIFLPEVDTNTLISIIEDLEGMVNKPSAIEIIE